MNAIKPADIYHVTPITPDPLLQLLVGRNFCVSYWRPDQIRHMDKLAANLMIDNGAYSEWQDAMEGGQEWFLRDDWKGYYDFLEKHLFKPNRWCIIPDAPGAPSQLNDALLDQFPFDPAISVPLWHMDGPISRLARLCDRYPKVALGWIGEFDPFTGKIRKDQRKVGCDAYRAKMDEVAALFGNKWHPTHMMRGIAVATDYPFDSADASSLGKNHHRYRAPLFAGTDDEWRGQIAYADKLERRRA